MACTMETKRAYVAPTLNLLVIRAEERFTASSAAVTSTPARATRTSS